LVDMGGREWYISTCGICVDGLEGDAFDYISGNIVDDLQEGDYAACFNTFAERSDEVINLVRGGESYKVPFAFFKTLMICLVIGFVVSLIVTLSMKSKLKSVRSKAEATDYLKKGSLNVTLARDMFLYRQVTRTEKPQSSSSSSSHTSSSGRTHGGGGGSF
ncbi:MAG: TPM domain-containing protein, partial [Clostridia bacterium]|nr:TPM domain-containing protein [Clostridia bacterium]